MKILIITDYYPPDKIGGVGEIAKNLKKTFEQKGHEVWVLTTGQSDNQQRVIRGAKGLIMGILLNNLRAIKLIHKHKFDIINIHQGTTTLFLLTKHIPFLYSRFPRVVNSFQVSYFSEFAHIRRVAIRGNTFKPTRKEYIEKWIFAPVHIFLDIIGYLGSDEITVVSSENKKEIKKDYGRLSKKEIHVIPNGVDTKDFAPKQSQLSSDLSKTLRGKTVLLYVGVFRVRKRVFNLLFALQEVLKNNRDVVLVLVGGGRNYEHDILRLVKELGIEKNIYFVGKIPNKQVIDYLHVADVFCLLSSYEGMPVALLEAMASGTTVLTSSVSGMLDLVEDAKTGYLVPVDNLDQIVAKLMQLVTDPDATKKMGEQARANVMQSYDWNGISEQYLKLFGS